jgi:cell shape-determining protein MreC
MDELKLVKVLVISLLLQILLLTPRVISWGLGFVESVFRILKTIVDSFVKELKKEVLK